MTVDETLTPLSLDNLAEVIEHTRRQLEARGGLDASGANAMSALARLTPETAAPLFLKDVTMIALGQGTDLFLHEPSTYETEGTLPWGGATVLMVGSFRLAEVDPDRGRARVQWSQEIEPSSLIGAMPALLAGIVGDAPTPNNSDMEAKIQSQMSGATFENDRACDYVIDMHSGLAEKVECVTTITFSAGDESARSISRLTATQELVP